MQISKQKAKEKGGDNKSGFFVVKYATHMALPMKRGGFLF